MKKNCFVIGMLLLIIVMHGRLVAQQEKLQIEKKLRKSTIKAFPYVFYTPETELAFGVGGIFTFYTARDSILRPSKLTLSGYYSTNDQYKITLVPQVYFAENRWLVTTPTDFGRYVDRFYGIGNDTPDLGNEEYISKAFSMRLEVQMPPFLMKTDRTGFIYSFMNNTVTDTLQNPYLTSGSVIGAEGGITSGLGFSWVWDTRDSEFFPNSGGLSQLRFIWHSKVFGSDFNFTSFEAFLRRYWAHKPDKVIAFELYGNFAVNEVPFYQLPALGGQNRMRGYFLGRFRDRTYFATQIEYRSYFWWRFGFVAFAGVGEVAPRLGDWRIKDFKYTYGVGLRFKFNQTEKVNIRVDYGRGKGTSGVYFGLEEAF